MLGNKDFNYEYEVYYLLIKDTSTLFDLKKVGFETQNTLAHVEFDYNIVYEYEDNPEEEVIGFFHTHPKGCDYMSSTDVETMKAWAKCIGRKLLCVIDSGQVNSWWCYPDGSIEQYRYFENREELYL